jgi:hypothetical protein
MFDVYKGKRDMKMKCDKCKNLRYNASCSDQPFSEVWCSKGHWEGIYDAEPEVDPWKDCADYVYVSEV